MLVVVPEANVSALERALRGLSPAGLNLTIERGAHDQSEPPARVITLDILGNERPGIVRDVTQALTRLGVNIESFSSAIESAPFSGAAMFRASALLGVPEALPADELRDALERLATEIMVDLTVTADDPAARPDR